MAQQTLVQQSFNFVGGLNTEASYLTFPENTWKEGQNVVPQVNGQLHARTAIDFEPSHAEVLAADIPTASEDSWAFSLSDWVSAGGISEDFVVVQIGATLKFYSNVADSMSSTEKPFSIDLLALSSGHTRVVSPDTEIPNNEIACASINGKLLIVHKWVDPLLVTYDSVANTISTQFLTLQMRDLTGYTTTDYTTKPTSGGNFDLTGTAHYRYNLLNAGWSKANASAYGAAYGVYPALSAVWTAGKDGNLDFSPTVLDKIDFGSAPAPAGRAVLNVFYKDRTTAINATLQNGEIYRDALPVEITIGRPSTATFWAGRAWYAGVESAAMSSWIMFSQASLDDSKLDKCFQEGDPTSENMYDIVPTDGGIIPIYGIGIVHKLVPFHNSLLVFADNGVWRIVGGQSGFSATEYSVGQLTNIGAVNAQCVKVVEDMVFYMAHNGIYVVAPDQSGTTFSIKSITDDTIKTYVYNIPALAKQTIRMVYDETEKRIYWAYNSSTTQDGVTDRYTKDAMLVLDLRIKCFYTLVFPAAPTGSLMPHVIDGISTSGRSVTIVDNQVIDAALDNVIDASGNNVTAGVLSTPLYLTRYVKWLVCKPTGADAFNYTFADMVATAALPASTKFRDWLTGYTDGVPVDAHIVTGYNLAGNSDKQKEIIYMTTHMTKTETGFDSAMQVINPSSCLLSAQWDWTDASVAGKWSTEQQVYRHTRKYIPDIDVNTSVQSLAITNAGFSADIAFTFSPVAGPATSALVAVASTTSTVCAVRNNSSVVSTDGGATWGSYTIGGTLVYTMLASDGSKFVAASTSTSSRTIATSTDGITWVEHTNSLPAAGYVHSLMYANGLFVATVHLATAVDSVIVTSPDGIVWTTRLTVNVGANVLKLSEVGYDGTSFLAHATSYTVLAAPLGMYFYTSTDGVTWSSGATYPSLVEAITIAPFGGDWYLGTRVGVYKYDGTTTPTIVGPSGVYLTAATDYNVLAISPASNAFASSSDGVTWSSGTIGGTVMAWYSAIGVGTTFYIAAATSAVEAIQVSKASLTFTSAGVHPLTFTGDGVGASGTYTINALTGTISNVTLTSGGTGYTVAPTVGTPDGGVVGAVITPTMFAGTLVEQSDGHALITTRNKVRGRGKAVAFKFQNETDKDMKLVGWEVTYLGSNTH